MASVGVSMALVVISLPQWLWNGFIGCVYDLEGVARLQCMWHSLIVCGTSKVGVALHDIASVAMAWSRHGLRGCVYDLSVSRCI